MATNSSEAAVLAAATLSSSLGFTNTKAGTAITGTDLEITSNYGQVNAPRPAEETRLMNKTGPVDQKEILSYRNRHIDSINTYNKIYYPARVTSGQEFGIRLDEVLRTEDENGFIICDEPIVLSVSFKAPMSNNLTNAVLTTIFKRMMGMIAVDATGNMDWLSLMMGSTNPLVG